MGRIVHIVENQQFDFSQVPVTGTARVLLAKGVDLGDAAKVRALVRVYSSVIPSGNLEVQVFQAWPTSVDPKELYELVAPGGASRAVILKGQLPVVSVTPYPAVYLTSDGTTGGAAVASNVGPTLDLFLVATVGATVGLTCGITVALELWDA